MNAINTTPATDVVANIVEAGKAEYAAYKAAEERECKTETDHLFAKVFKNAKTIEFNPAWKNGTGYYDNITADFNRHLVPAGEVRRSLDEYNRRLLIVGTFFGPVVVFDRHRNGESGVYVQNTSTELRRNGIVTASSSITFEQMMEIIGSEWDIQYGNAGQRLERIRQSVAMFEKADRIKEAKALIHSAATQALEQ